MNKKLLLLLVAPFLVFAAFSQTPVDGFQYVLGDKGIDSTTGAEYSVLEQINAATYTVIGYTDIEINEMYPNFISSTPDRGSVTTTNRHVDSDAGDWSPGGIHPGEDWNVGAAGDDTGLPIYATANGVVYDFRPLSIPISKSGWCMVIKHIMPDGSDVYSFYMHITNISNAAGAICLNESDFGFTVGEEVVRGQMIARIGDVTSFGDHLHFEMRTYYNSALALWPNGPGGRYPESSAAYATSISMEKVAQAYYEMQLDSIIDASDFIDAHRPNLYANLAPEIEWQNTIGGNDYDYLLNLNQTNDGGYVLGGYSTSPLSGDKTEPSFLNIFGQRTADYWVMKLNSAGDSIEWQNTVGGNNTDICTSILQTSDNGYILGGLSYSGVSVDKSEPNIGSSDIWLVKIDSLGAIQWDETIGGSSIENLWSMDITPDGGYILGASSSSNASADKIESNIGANDFWVVKLDAFGDIEWENTIGGNSEDFLNVIKVTPDGGYILGGFSSSGVSGDKTAANKGEYDFWVIKLNSTGNTIEWQKTLGGNQSDVLNSIQVTPDGGYILGGYSSSGISGDKTEANIGSNDFWVIKLNILGDTIWQKTIGGTASDYITSMDIVSDGGYILGGISQSNISGDKSENSIGDDDFWIVKTNEIGDIEWQKTIGGSLHDNLYSTHETVDGGYILGGYSNSGISGHKTETAIGSEDYWIIKLFGNCTPSTEICNSIDDDCDGVVDNDIIVTIGISAGGPTTFCQGGSVLLTATHSGTSIQWKKNEVYISGATSSTYTATTSGTYTAVTTSACGAATSAGISVIANKNPTATITAGGATTFCAGGSVTLTANAGGGLSYQWYKGATAITGATSINYVATTTGNYKCCVTKNATGCFKNSNAIAVSVTCKEGEPTSGISFYPNPASNTLTVSFSQLESADIALVNEVGQIVLRKNAITGGGVELDVSALPKGLYVIRLLQDGHIIQSDKCIIE